MLACQVRLECLTCTFRASCCSAHLSWAHAFAGSSECTRYLLCFQFQWGLKIRNQSRWINLTSHRTMSGLSTVELHLAPCGTEKWTSTKMMHLSVKMKLRRILTSLGWMMHAAVRLQPSDLHRVRAGSACPEKCCVVAMETGWNNIKIIYYFNKHQSKLFTILTMHQSKLFTILTMHQSKRRKEMFCCFFFSLLFFQFLFYFNLIFIF